ncbi:amidohydrolase family protein [Arthrobacter sp. C9C5]|uniref:N-acetylglucosamine-6-phosphate deacetylase n=1 Tax=Arthrobacter sp. C9C5 TaxID=2735267 RepID=UPI001584EA13|nr:amidohydrolase family protein [Arthrobacter sp. C9C5]NUU32100.1 amidohydrolase family protein [Arthrobacter sp. C9C5]
MNLTQAGRHLLYGTLVSDGAVQHDAVMAVAGGRIAYAGPAAGFNPEAAGFRDAPAPELPPGALILPGLVDLHCHGAYGGDFPGGGEIPARRAIDFLHRSGTTTLLASLVTASRESLLHGIALLAGLSEEGLLAGIHLEGPFLAAARCGAQDADFLRDPHPGLLAELVAAARGTLATMSFAPELSGADGLVPLLAGHGVVPSLGHTDCDDATAAAALRSAGEALRAESSGRGTRPTVTHLFNGMPPLHHRAPGPVAACLRSAASGEAVLELIADGTHLDPAVVATVFQLAGAANIALVTDSMAAAGLPDGAYSLGRSAVTVSAGVARLDAGGSLAGGTATLLEVVRRTVAAGVPLPDAVRSATAVPAAVLGLGAEVGSLRRGLRADAVVVNSGLGLYRVMRCGEWLAPLS